MNYQEFVEKADMIKIGVQQYFFNYYQE